MPRRGPQLELGVSRCPQLQQPIVAAVVKLETGHRLGVAAIEAFGQPQDGRERANGPAPLARQVAKVFVAPFGRGLAMVAGHERDGLDFVRIEPAQVAVLDQVVPVLVVAFVADVDADVVEERGVFQPFTLAIGQPVHDARLLEQCDRQPRHLLGVFRPVVATLGELEDAPPADVGVAIGLRDFLPVPCDVVEHETLAEREVAQGDVVGAQAPEDGVEENCAGDRQIGASRLEPWNAKPFLQVAGDEGFSGPPQQLGRNAAVPERRTGRLAPFGLRHGAETENRARRADDAIEARPHNLIEVLADLGVHVLGSACARPGAPADRS